MIRLSWRQFRTPAVVGAGALLLLAILLLVTGGSMFHTWDTTVANCQKVGDCSNAQGTFGNEFQKLQPWINAAILVMPALLGIFWGAPLISRELESGTFRLAWTQGIRRERWLLVKVGVVGVCTAAFAGFVSLLVTWWFSLLDSLNQTPYSVFDHRDLAPVGYGFFAFALGVTAGVVLRRVVPAMAVTLVGFVGLRLLDFTWLRPHLLSPLSQEGPLELFGINGPGIKALTNGSWVISQDTINAAGQVIGQNGGIGPNGNIDFQPTANGMSLAGAGNCPGIHPPNPTLGGGPRGGGHTSKVFSQQAGAAAQQCVNYLHLRDLVYYQPQNRYWTFQWLELGIWVGAGLVLLGFCFWWFKRRLS